MCRCLDAPLLAQRGRGYNPGFRVDPVIEKIPYDGRFTLVRLLHQRPRGFSYRGLPAWRHGYPNSELNLMRIVSEIGAVPSLQEHGDGARRSAVVQVSGRIHGRGRLLGMTTGSRLPARVRRKALSSFSTTSATTATGYQGWATFTQQMKRVPADVVEPHSANPIFHSFFDINSFDIVPQDYDRGRPIFRGIYEIRVLRRSVYVVLHHPNFERAARRSREQDQSRNRQNHAHDRNHRRIVENPVGRRSVRNAGKAGQPSEVVY